MQKPVNPARLAAETRLKRRSEKRSDAAYIDAALGRADAKVLALFDLRFPIVPSADGTAAPLHWLSPHEVEAIAKPHEFVFLGEEEDGAPVFTCNLEPDETAHATARARKHEAACRPALTRDAGCAERGRTANRRAGPRHHGLARGQPLLRALRRPY